MARLCAHVETALAMPIPWPAKRELDAALQARADARRAAVNLAEYPTKWRWKRTRKRRWEQLSFWR
jgi:hypothetical protein